MSRTTPKPKLLRPELSSSSLTPDSSVTLYKLEHPTAKGSSITLSQARYAQAFGVTTYLAPQPSDGDSTPTKVQRDLLVIGCSKKVVVYGAGARLGEAWELSLQHTPRQVIFPAPVYADLPGAVHLLYSPHASVILNIKTGVPSNQRLSATELPSTGYPAPKGGVAKPAGPSEAGGWGVSRLGGFMRGTAPPVGTRTVGGEVVLIREGKLGYRILADRRTWCLLLVRRQLHARRVAAVASST